MRLVLVVGARPQFIKAAAFCWALPQDLEFSLLHTGQHYDFSLTDVFFRELNIPEPGINLGVGSGRQGAQTAAMLSGVEEFLIEQKPDWVIVFGDTNSTLAGALAAAKLHIPLAHVEAGLRSFNRQMPEEINRILTDHISDLLFCPSQTAIENLEREGIIRGVHLVGDMMADALAYAKQRAEKGSQILDHLQLPARSYLIATVHRAENTEDPHRLKSIFSALSALDEPVIVPLHPRTRQVLSQLGLLREDGQVGAGNLFIIPPQGYVEMIALEKSARLILTDSGGVQKEAYWLGVPCITLREETEWVETVEVGWNVLAGADAERIRQLVKTFEPPPVRPVLYGDGRTAQRCISILLEEKK